MRLIVRKERPHPGTQLRITDADGMRITCFATNTTGRPINPVGSLRDAYPYNPIDFEN